MDDLTISASGVSAYTATSGNGTVGAVNGKGTATATGAYGKQTATVFGYGVRDFVANLSNVGGTKITAGTGTLTSLTGTGTADATGYYATSNSKGIDPSFVSAGGGSYGKGSVGAITGNATATATGDATKGTAYSYATGIDSLTVNSGSGYKGTGSIGAITGYGKAVQSGKYTGGYGTYGISDSAFTSGGAKGGGTIGAVKGTAFSTNGAAVFGIDDTTAYAATDLGNIGGYANSGYVATYGIKNSAFVANGGNIGAISANAAKASAAGSYTHGIYDSLFSAGGNIGNISVTKGDIGGGTPYTAYGYVRILAGFSAGANLTVDAGDTAVAGKSIGSVSVQGRFISSDLIASVDDGGDAAWGQGNDVSTGSGSIGGVTIGFPITPYTAAYGVSGLYHGIEAKTLGAISWGGSAIASDTLVDAGNSGAVGFPSDVRVRAL
jgi:hypothetical protein